MQSSVLTWRRAHRDVGARTKARATRSRGLASALQGGPAKFVQTSKSQNIWTPKICALIDVDIEEFVDRKAVSILYRVSLAHFSSSLSLFHAEPRRGHCRACKRALGLNVFCGHSSDIKYVPTYTESRF